MSVNALKPTLSAIRADGHLTLDEVKTLTNPNNGLGVNTDNDEFEVFKRLSADVKVGNQLKNVTPDVVKEINDKNKERLVHKGVKIGGAVGGGVGGTAFVAVAATVIGLAAAAGGYAILGVFWAVPVALGIGAAIAGIAVGIGALAGYIRSRRNPITASEIKRKSPLAMAAAQFKKNPLVKRGVKIGGIIGGVISGLGAVPLGFLAVAAVMWGGSAAGLIVAAPVVLGLLGGAVCLMIGLGALGGYIHSKVKGHNHENPLMTADPEAVALIEETVQNGVTSD